MNLGNRPALTCPNCGQPLSADIEQIIDVGRDPSAKARLLAGQINVATCPSCGMRVGIGTPLLYHDPAKELLLVYVPMELGLQQADQERLIGDLLNGLMNGIPAEERRGYMLQPRTVLTLQGLIEQILAADGVTPEMLEAQKAKAQLAETFLQANVDDLEGLVEQHDDQIDMEVLQMIALAAENALQSGRQDMAGHALRIRDRLLKLSTAGQKALQQAEMQEQAIQDVAKALEELGPRATRDDFMNLVIQYADDDEHLQALVGLQYPLFDYAFFQELSGRINQAPDGEKAKLESLRERLLELTTLIKQQQEALVQAAVDVLREIMGSDDLETAIRRNLPRIDDTFLAVLSANIQAAEQNKDLMTSARLKKIYDTIMDVLQDSAPPELRFISDLLRAESPEAARAMIDEHAPHLGEGLLPLMDALATDLQQRGDQEMLSRLQDLRAYAAAVLEQAAS